ncbi:MAG: hypothetical protein RJA59_1264 [Pseudomonadota bacterium]|jgi:hypothetical protein
MTVSLNISITSPLDEKDHELLAGLAMMTLAIANHEGAIKQDTEEEKTEPQIPELVPPCAFVNEEKTLICIGAAGHRGRHKMRPIPAEDAEAVGLPN